MSEPLRSIYERMTAPTESDLTIKSRLQTLGRQEVIRMVDHLRQVMEQLAAQRDDITVTRIEDGGYGFSVRVNTGAQNSAGGGLKGNAQ